MLNDAELRKLQKILPRNDTVEAFNCLLGMTHDLYNLKPCPICFNRNLSYDSEGASVPDGRVVCLTCGARTRKYDTHDQRYIKAVSLYRNMRSARDSWNKGRILKKDDLVPAQAQEQVTADKSAGEFIESLGF